MTASKLIEQYNAQIVVLDGIIATATATIPIERKRDNNIDTNVFLAQAIFDRDLANAKRQIYFQVTKDLEDLL